MAKTSSAPRVWTVGDLGAFYTQHRAELHAHASRVLKDSIKAEEITQGVLIKLMLATQEPKLDEHGFTQIAQFPRGQTRSNSQYALYPCSSHRLET
jgi:hypothetical protein